MAHSDENARRILRREQEMKFGTVLLDEGVRFRLWAPYCDRAEVEIGEERTAMAAVERGWHQVDVPRAAPGTRYRFVLDNGKRVPDPASRFQPEDVDGPSEVIDPLAFAWTDAGWRGRPWEEAVIQEIHIGTFTPEGTFAAAAEKLGLLAEIGFTAVELMPIADFHGRWNWGYDGAALFAPYSTYGRPEDLKAFINRAHHLGLMVFLDVVYNHLGPKGNYLPDYSPTFHPTRESMWGEALNLDGRNAIMVRDFFLANARFWLNEYRFDGLRLDAVHAIEDKGPKHLLQTLAEEARAATDGRRTHLIVENSDNQAGWLKRRDDGAPWLFTAQWNDDLHHALHWAATGENFSYYADFEGRVDLAARALAEGLGWQGEFLEHEGRRKGEPSAFLPPTAFVSFIQNHDHIGNRPHGERLPDLASPAALKALTAILLLSPQIPLFFMGQEWGTRQPFHFFSDFSGEIGEEVRRSRAEELAEAARFRRQDSLRDPLDIRVFEESKLDWRTREWPDARAWLAFHKTLIDIRRREIVPRIFNVGGHAGEYRLIGDRGFSVEWTLGDGTILHLLANLSDTPEGPLPKAPPGRLIWDSAPEAGEVMVPWLARFHLREAGPARDDPVCERS